MAEGEARLAQAVEIPAWVKAVVIVCAALTGMGAVIAFARPGMLLQPNAEVTASVRTYAGYLVARNLALALMLLALLMARAGRALGNLLAIVGMIQLLDCAMDCLEARWTIAPGVLILGILFLVAARRLCGPLWKRDAWL